MSKLSAFTYLLAALKLFNELIGSIIPHSAKLFILHLRSRSSLMIPSRISSIAERSALAQALSNAQHFFFLGGLTLGDFGFSRRSFFDLLSLKRSLFDYFFDFAFSESSSSDGISKYSDSSNSFLFLKEVSNIFFKYSFRVWNIPRNCNLCSLLLAAFLHCMKARVFLNLHLSKNINSNS